MSKELKMRGEKTNREGKEKVITTENKMEALPE